MQPIVSICVVTYNNEKYVQETLDSVKNQNYEKIELIISDDNSTDDTLLKVNNWIEKNKDRFVNVKVITFGKNTGVTANCNRAVKASNGEFVKIIGDDLLKQDYLEKCIIVFLTLIPRQKFCVQRWIIFIQKKNLILYKSL